MVEGSPAHPARSPGRGLERRQEEVAPRPRRVPSVGDVTVERRVAGAAIPAGPGRTDRRIDDRVDRRALLGGCGGADDVKVHGCRV